MTLLLPSNVTLNSVFHVQIWHIKTHCTIFDQVSYGRRRFGTSLNYFFLWYFYVNIFVCVFVCLFLLEFDCPSTRLLVCFSSYHTALEQNQRENFRVNLRGFRIFVLFEITKDERSLSQLITDVFVFFFFWSITLYKYGL